MPLEGIMLSFDVQSVALNASAGEAFRFIADPARLPHWAHAFKHAEHGRAVMETPHGAAEIGLRVSASESAGTVDWEMTFSDGSVSTAYSRIVPNGPQSSIYIFVLKAPPVAQELVEGTLGQQRRILANELAKLRELLSR